MRKLSFRLDPLFLVLAFGIGWLNSPTLEGILLWAIVIFISIFVHELGHALTALAFGQSAEVTFMPLGGMTTRNGPKLTPLKEFLIVLNGPLAGFTLYFLCSFFLTGMDTSHPLGYMLLIGTYINLIWTILNLFPVLPLDGGRLVMIVLEKCFGVKGGQIAYGVSLAFAAFFALFFFLIQQLFAGALFALFAFESYRGFQMGRQMTPADEDQALKATLEKGGIAYQEGHLQEASVLMEEIRSKTKAGLLYLNATFYLAKILREQGNFEEAYFILSREKSNLDADGLEELQQLAFLTKQFEEAASIGERAFQEKPSVNTAFINALSLSQLQQVVPAVGWFETAVREGLENPKASSLHLAFDPIRTTLEFRNFADTL